MILKRAYLLFVVCLFLVCCKTEVENIKIGNTLYEQQDLSTNKRFADLIKRTLSRDSAALIELINFNCGGAAGCYDLGSVITQIVNRIGEYKFLKMVSQFSNQQKLQIRNFIVVGLEYGYRLNVDMENKTIDKQFPEIDKILPK